MPSSSKFGIRPATTAKFDHELLVDFQESQISWLSTVGSSEQWGTESIRKKSPQVSDRTRAWIERSEKKDSWNGDWCRAFIAEADGQPVAGLVLDSKANAYVPETLLNIDERGKLVYVAYLISDRNAGDDSKGVGAALIEFAKEEARAAGIKRLCLDCWRGNDRKLVKYYEKQGFVPVGDFVPTEKEWPGCVMEMQL